MAEGRGEKKRKENELLMQKGKYWTPVLM